ncbi:hypothetical protein [Streptomyces sp. NBC_01012]|uniref:hypothetical protein n=1 Tax=Streptomyces sp. NBC_01012 TaxID=2903717 RepID=UPI003870EC5E|nr:hypothetical protein OG623_18140 [Streptomyces sp. NBC_01012]
MSERQSMTNDLSGNVEGPVVQAQSVGTVDLSSRTKIVNNIIQEARSLNLGATLYRLLASAMALATLIGARRWGTPLDGAATVCEALAIPTDWTESTASWIAVRPGIVGGVAQILLLVGLLASPRPGQLGRDLGQTLEWRGPSTMIVSLALLVQSGQAWPALITLGSCAALGLVMLRRSAGGYSRADHVSVILGGLALAVLFAPLFVFAWFFGRDWRRKRYAYGASE